MVQDVQQKCSRSVCRSCEQIGLLPVLDLGEMPLTAAFVDPDRREIPERRYPLEVAFCPHCTLVQVLDTVPPEEVFHADYPYYSSFSETLLRHSRENAEALIQSRHLGPDSLVVEVASNDGYLLRNFVSAGIPVLGIDPAPGPTSAARKQGVPTLCEFFSRELAQQLRRDRIQADVLLANNVMAHVADLNGFVEGLRILLNEDGVLVTESPYIRDLMDACEFDTIYHEHLCYYSLTALDRLFRRHGLYVNHVERLPIHGGSLRLYVQATQNVGPAVKQMLMEEADAGIDRLDAYQAFAGRVAALRNELRVVLAGLKKEGRSIAAYGAAAKGCILLNYLGVGAETIDWVVDRNVHKHGKLLPGVQIPVLGTDALMEKKPDYVLLLAWNFKEEILAQQQPYLRSGGQFIIPVPSPQIVGA